MGLGPRRSGGSAKQRQPPQPPLGGRSRLGQSPVRRVRPRSWRQGKRFGRTPVAEVDSGDPWPARLLENLPCSPPLHDHPDNLAKPGWSAVARAGVWSSWSSMRAPLVLLAPGKCCGGPGSPSPSQGTAGKGRLALHSSTPPLSRETSLHGGWGPNRSTAARVATPIADSASAMAAPAGAMGPSSGSSA